MTRNEALEKIESYIYDNFQDVSAPVCVAAKDLLNFIEDELKMFKEEELEMFKELKEENTRLKKRCNRTSRPRNGSSGNGKDNNVRRRKQESKGRK